MSRKGKRMTAPMVGMISLPGMGASAATVQAIHAELVATGAMNSAASAAVTPPGDEGASALAVAQHAASAADFAAKMEVGLEQIQEWVATQLAATAATALTDAGNAVASAI